MRFLRKNPRLVGNGAYYILSMLKWTLRFKIIMSPKIDTQQQYLLAFWHGKQLLPALYKFTDHKTPLCALVSPSRDGALLSTFLNKLGYETVRGSSRDGGARALLEIKSKLEQGYSMGIAVDGPIGPMHEVKPGIIFLAKKLNLPVIAVGSASSRFWQFRKAWDKFQLPKPFAKCALVFSDPITIDHNAEVNDECRRLENLLHNLEEQATVVVNN